MARAGAGVDSQFVRGLDRVELCGSVVVKGTAAIRRKRGVQPGRAAAGSGRLKLRWRPVSGAVVVLPQNLMYPLSCKPIASVPKLANRTPLALVIILGWHDADSGLCRLMQVRAIEGNRRNRPSPQSLSGFLSQALEKPIFHHAGLLERAHDRSCPSAGM